MEACMHQQRSLHDLTKVRATRLQAVIWLVL